MGKWENKAAFQIAWLLDPFVCASVSESKCAYVFVSVSEYTYFCLWFFFFFINKAKKKQYGGDV